MEVAFSVEGARIRVVQEPDNSVENLKSAKTDEEMPTIESGTVPIEGEFYEGKEAQERFAEAAKLLFPKN